MRKVLIISMVCYCSTRAAGFSPRGHSGAEAPTVTGNATWSEFGGSVAVVLEPVPITEDGGSARAEARGSPAARSASDAGDSDDPAPEPVAAATRGVLGGKHDFSKLTDRAGDGCGACHVPHVMAVRPKTDADGTAALEFYRIGGQREVLVPDRYTPGPSSLICLSCHNGTVATSAVGSSHAMLAGVREGFEMPEGFALRDHPIGVEYPANEKGFRPRTMVLAEGTIRLPEGRLECVSCHDPHNASGVAKMLVKSNRRSALCLSCHVK